MPDAPITWLPLDLSSFSSIKDAASTFNKSSDRLDLLFNNAGIMMCAPALTKEGYETQFGTNHVGHALFTKLLLPTLQKTAKEPGSDVRIINVSSAGEAMAPKGGIVFDHLKTDMAAYYSIKRYGQSKLANVHFTRSLATKYPDIKSIVIHPGVVTTNLTDSPKAQYPILAPIINLMSKFTFFSMPVNMGTWNQLWAASSEKAQSGTLYFPVGKVNAGSSYSQDADQSEKLWQWTEKEFAEHGF